MSLATQYRLESVAVIQYNEQANYLFHRYSQNTVAGPIKQNGGAITLDFAKKAQLNSVCEDEDDQDNDFSNVNAFSRGDIFSNNDFKSSNSHSRLPSVPPLCLDDGGDGDEKVSRLRLPQFHIVARIVGWKRMRIVKASNSSRNRLHDEVVRLSSIEYNRRFLTTEEQEFLVNSQQDVIPQELLELLDRLVSLDFNEMIRWI
uniref:Uncharacterized protein n=1 Tax=Ditylenchus dipsaci TaxID=166011 RepID=A0A915E5V1_9BILA